MLEKYVGYVIPRGEENWQIKAAITKEEYTILVCDEGSLLFNAKSEMVTVCENL